MFVDTTKPLLIEEVDYRALIPGQEPRRQLVFVARLLTGYKL